MRKMIIAAWLLALMSGTCCAEGKLEGLKERINYSVGYQIGGDFKSQGVELTPDLLVQGVRDALEEKKPLLHPEEMRKTLVDFKKKIEGQQSLQRKQAAEAHRREGRDFLAANGKKEGVVTRPSGIQYKILKEGKGKSPSANDTVIVQYAGTLIDGTEFDSSIREGKPAAVPLPNAIPGWKEALPLMKEGAKWQLVIPPDLAFGDRGPLADRTVIYEIELVAVNPASGK